MAFAGSEDNPELGEENCPDNWRVWVHCPNLKRWDGDTDMSGEWYKCEKCGRIEFADYDEMR